MRADVANKFYAVKKGRTPGIYNDWETCKKQTAGFKGAIYKSFTDAGEAASYMGWTGETKEKAEKKCALTAYVDGSYNIATKEYGSGVVILNGEEEIHLYEKGNNSEMTAMRNVAGEILAAEMAMRYALDNGYDSIEIVHDYEGIARWCLGEWKANKEGTIRYREVYKEISKNVHIKFTKVKGHSGDKYNDIADMLAKKAAEV